MSHTHLRLIQVKPCMIQQISAVQTEDHSCVLSSCSCRSRSEPHVFSPSFMHVKNI